MIEFTIMGEIPSLKNTLTVSYKDGKRRFYHTNNNVLVYKNSFSLLCPNKHKLNIDKPVAVELKIYKKDNRKDGCNLSDMVYDALQFARVIKNDRLVVERHEFDFIDKERPRVEIKIKEVE